VCMYGDCVYVCIHAGNCVYVCIHAGDCVYVCTHERTRTHAHASVHTRTRTCTQTHVHTHILIHTHTRGAPNAGVCLLLFICVRASLNAEAREKKGVCLRANTNIVAVRCSALQCAAVRGSVLQCVATHKQAEGMCDRRLQLY